MNKNNKCSVCDASFNIDSKDIAFYDRIGVLPPHNCPACRARLRLVFRNERNFYRRACDRCGKDGVSMYHPGKPYTVWCYDCWFKDDWDPMSYGRFYDPNRPFFEQFEQVWRAVPKIALIHVNSVNCEYLNISADNKDCYMIVESSNNENCIHCYWIQQCRDLIDVSFAHQTELSYESDDCYNGYKLLYCKGCHDCRESYFLLNCTNCANCFGSINLRNKQYCVFNEQKSRAEYEKILTELKLDTFDGVRSARDKCGQFFADQPQKYAEIVNAPDCSGNYITNAKDCRSCFHTYDAENCAYGVHVWRSAKDCMDVDTAGRNAELIYNSMNAGLDVSNYICSSLCWSSSFLRYCYYCFNSTYCFGSTGLRKKSYCILNKQYSKEEYDRVSDLIIQSMKESGEYGQFFPARVSTFGYNESAAHEQFPLSKEQALTLGFSWEDSPRGTYGKENVSWEEVSRDESGFRTRDLSQTIFACLTCQKNFRIIPREQGFYSQLAIPLPRLCPDCRHSRRFKARGPNKITTNTCSCNKATHQHADFNCRNTFLTPYSDKSSLYCEACYQSEFA